MTAEEKELKKRQASELFKQLEKSCHEAIDRNGWLHVKAKHHTMPADIPGERYYTGYSLAIDWDAPAVKIIAEKADKLPRPVCNAPIGTLLREVMPTCVIE